MIPPLVTDSGKFHDQLLQRARTIGFKTVLQTDVETIQADQLPFISIYLREENSTRDGDAGQPLFLTEARYGMQIVLAVSNEDQQRFQLDDGIQKLLAAILTDPSTLNFVEQPTRYAVRRVYTRVGETPIVQAYVDMSFRWHTIWDPVVEDDFLTLHIETTFPIDGTKDQQSGVIQVERNWDIQQN